jgi:hypothetical protein
MQTPLPLLCLATCLACTVAYSSSGSASALLWRQIGGTERCEIEEHQRKIDAAASLAG